MAVKVVYVTESGTPAMRSEDPVLKKLDASCVDIGATSDIAIEAVLNDICEEAEEGARISDGCVIIIHAFLNPRAESVADGLTWDPERERLRELITFRGPDSETTNNKCLASLRLMWSLWDRIRGQAKIFVTTDNVQLSTHSERALETAFSAGKACQLYSWKDSVLHLSDVASSVIG